MAPGGRGIDDFDGGNSADHIYGAGDRDAITVANSADVLYGGGDNDTIPDVGSADEFGSHVTIA
jgi:hypothetical protein